MSLLEKLAVHKVMHLSIVVKGSVEGKGVVAKAAVETATRRLCSKGGGLSSMGCAWSHRLRATDKMKAILIQSELFLTTQQHNRLTNLCNK